MPGARAASNYSDRRTSRRYALALPVSYRVFTGGTDRAAGTGTSADISSRGIRFHAEGGLQPGSRVEVSVRWPMLLEDRCGLQLRLTGRVVRSDQRGVSVEVWRHEFRTLRSGAKPDEGPLPRFVPE